MVLWLSNKIQQNDFIFKELQLSVSEVTIKENSLSKRDVLE